MEIAHMVPPLARPSARGSGSRVPYQQPVLLDDVPAEPIVVLEPGVVELAPGVVEPDMPPPLPSVVPELPDKDPFAPDVPLESDGLVFAPRVLVEPARSSAPLPVEPDEPIAVPVPAVVPDVLPLGLPAAPIADVVPGECRQGVVELVLAPGLVVELELLLDPGLLLLLEPGLLLEPDEVWANARPAAVAKVEAVISIANVFLLALMFKLLGAVERMVRFPGNPRAQAHGFGGARQVTPLVSH